MSSFAGIPPVFCKSEPGAALAVALTSVTRWCPMGGRETLPFKATCSGASLAMFGRVREAIRILSYKHEPLHPDLSSGPGDEVQVSSASSKIGRAIEYLLIAMAAGLVADLVFGFVSNHHTLLSTGTVLGITGAVMALLGESIFGFLNREIHLGLKLGEKLAPYFGHKLQEVLTTLRG